jgi:hypothetical protein
VDTIARDYDIELVDKSSGYLRTAWAYGISGGNAQRYRGRLTVKFSDVKTPEKVEIKTDAAWLSSGGPFSYPGWVPGYDTAFQRDIFTALSGRLGRTVPKDSGWHGDVVCRHALSARQGPAAAGHPFAAGYHSSTTTANRSPAIATFAGSVVCATFSNGR